MSQEDLDDESGDREISSAVERPRQEHYYTDCDEPEGHQGPPTSFRGRARSLSNTLGELLGVRRKSRTEPAPDHGERDGEHEPFIERRTTDRSHETL